MVANQEVTAENSRSGDVLGNEIPCWDAVMMQTCFGVEVLEGCIVVVGRAGLKNVAAFVGVMSRWIGCGSAMVVAKRTVVQSEIGAVVAGVR